MTEDLDLVGKLSQGEVEEWRFALRCFNPDDAKYRKAGDPLRNYLTHGAELLACVEVQRALLETRVEFGQAKPWHLNELLEAMGKVDALNIHLLEEKLRHDQQAVLAEIGRHVSKETAALLHPGTTSYDIVDTARAYLLKKAWFEVIRSKVGGVVNQFCDFAEQTMDVIQVGRTHLQNTSPVPFGVSIAGYATRMAERTEVLDNRFNDLRGKVRGIVGTGASIEMVIGRGRASEFEEAVLIKLGLKPDYASTQITQKERLVDIGSGLVNLASVLGDFAGDVRILYSSPIRELISSDSSRLLGGSSADAAKDNPVIYENIEGKVPVVSSGMAILNPMVMTDLQRDLRGSVQARYEPQLMMARTYEMFVRINKAIEKLGLNVDAVERNLIPVREFPSEAMVAILRGEGWIHSKQGDGHEFVKKMSQRAKEGGRKLMDVALQDEEFGIVYRSLPEEKQKILQGEMELYLGDSQNRARNNIEYARSVAKAA